MLFVVLRRLETWLHQHIFKVGWLTTKNFQTTTILYYTFFLPGVIVHEVVYWLAAGFFNVRAQRALEWPDAQEIGELKLNFVQISPKANPIRVAIISTTPIIVGMIVVWFVANEIFYVPRVLSVLSPLSMQNIRSASILLLQTPDFWLWYYLVFTIGNTMFPDMLKLSGWRRIGVVMGVAIGILTILGFGNAVVLDFFLGPVANILNGISGVLLFIIAMNIVVVGLLYVIENTIEAITGDSADFKNGKMVTMTREERLSIRMREIEKQRAARERRKLGADVATGGPPSIYKHPLPLPAAPGEVFVTPLQQMISDDKEPTKKNLLERAGRAGVDVISGSVEDSKRQSSASNTLPQLPSPDEDDP